MSFISGISIATVIGIGVFICFILLIATGYVKAPTDTAYIISGLRKKSSSARPVLRFRS